MTFEGLETDDRHLGHPPGANRLTVMQREAIESDKPLLCVVAGAGAGKTRVLTLRVARRVREGSIEPDRTLVTTFSRKAAEELRTRLYSLGVSGVKAGTFHRTALGLLREHRELRGRPLPQLLPDRRRLLAEVTTGDARRTRALDGEIGWAKARLVSPEHYEAEARRHRRRSGLSAEQVADAFTRYEAERSRRRLLDFDDLIVSCADALAGDTEFADSIRWRTRHLFVDEMQDVNPAQFRLLTAMLADEPDLFVVGDPNQSVYGFNGADPTLLDRLPEILRGTAVIRLDENHRCTPQVVAVATAVLREGGAFGTAGEVALPRTTRVDGPVPKIVSHASDADEAAWVADRVKMSRTPGRQWSSIAVLTRTNAQLAVVQAALDKARVPNLVAGADLGPASDLRGDGEKRGVDSDGDEARTTDAPGRSGPRGAHHLPPRQGPAVADGDHPGSRGGPHAHRVGADSRRHRRGAAPPLRGADPVRRRALVQLVRRHPFGRSVRPRPQPVVGGDSADHHRAREGSGADGRGGGLAPRGRAPPRDWPRPPRPETTARKPPGKVGPPDPIRSDLSWGWHVACRNSWSSYARPSARATSSWANPSETTTRTMRR